MKAPVITSPFNCPALSRKCRSPRTLIALGVSIKLLSCSSSADIDATVGPARLCNHEPLGMVPVATDASGRQYALKNETKSSLQKVPWGSEHKVRLRIKTYKTSLALGGSSQKISRVISSSPHAGSRLALPVHASCINADRRSFVDGQKLECESAEVCQALDAELGKVPKKPFELIVKFPASPDAPLLIEGVRTSDERQCGYYPCKLVGPP